MLEIISVGVDQGIANIGYGVVKVTVDESGNMEVTLIESGLITTPSDIPMGLRTVQIVDSVMPLVKKYKPQILGCEMLFFSPARRGGRNKSASMMYTSMVTGLLHYVSGKTKTPIKEFVPGTIKKLVTGYGRSTKEEMMDTVYEKLNFPKDTKQNEHVADAISIAYASCLYYLENKEEVEEERKSFRKRRTPKK